MAIKKRTDALLCYDVPVYNHIYPYLLKKRCDSTVYYDVEIEVTNAIRFTKEWNRNHPELKIRLFSVILAAILRTVALRPHTNRFIANKTFWERKELSLSFVVKQDISDDSEETSTPLYFNRFATFEDTIKIIENYITESQKHDELNKNMTDFTISTLFKFVPKWLIEAIVRFYGRRDKRGHGTPKWVRDADGLHTSIFVANLGSVGMKNAHLHHHLYEWGTTSMFCVVESLYKTIEKDATGKITSSKDMMHFSFSLDERICDGLYFIKTVKLFESFILHPEEMLTPLTPDDIPHFMTKEEYQIKHKAQKAEVKARKKQAKLEKKQAKLKAQA